MKLVHWPVMEGRCYITNVTAPFHQRPLYESPYCYGPLLCGFNVIIKGLKNHGALEVWSLVGLKKLTGKVSFQMTFKSRK